MFILELIIDLAINAYVSLGFGTKEYKIEKKIEMLSGQYPNIMDIYLNNKGTFHTDEQLVDFIIRMNMREESDKRNAADFIMQRFT